MYQLAQYLQETLNEKYKTDATWATIAEKLSNGIDLEGALTEVNIGDALLSDIIKLTWILVSNADLHFSIRCPSTLIASFL